MRSISRHVFWLARLVAPGVALFLALLSLRLQLVLAMRLELDAARQAGLLAGVFSDAFVVLAVAVAASLVWAIAGVRLWLAWCSVAALVWLASLANLLYFSFFGMPLDWWIVKLHLRDVAMVEGSATHLGLAWPILASLAFLVAAISARVVWRRRAVLIPALEAPRSSFGKARLLALLRTAMIAPLLFTSRCIPDSAGHKGVTSTVLSDHVLRQWVAQNAHPSLFVKLGLTWADELDPSLLTAEERRSPSRALAELSELGRTEPRAAPADEDFPLVRALGRDAGRASEYRRRLGLPEQGPINVIMLFGESIRALELLHEELAPHAMPRTRALLDRHAVFFPQGYSSSYSAGQTVRGQFSTQCSALPNMRGAATYIAHNTLEVVCLAGLLKSHGYRTTWFNAYDAMFHGKKLFESLHGTQEFYDRDFFASRGIKQRVGSLGLADGPVLRETLKKLEELAALGQPLYANVLTISTHHPPTVVPEGPLPDILWRTIRNRDYAGHISQVIYADGAIADFVTALFAGPLGDNTLVVFLGDHSVPTEPEHLALSPAQLVELRFRIPIAFLTKNMPAPERRDYPVHQVDVTPTIAAILGLEGKVAWLGRDLLRGSGTPFVYATKSTLHYRVGDRACYTDEGAGGISCWDVSGIDPLLVAPSVALAEDLEETRFFTRVAHANSLAIVFNAFMPKAKLTKRPGSLSQAR